LLSNLQAGDTLVLEAGDYLDGLPVHDLNGTDAAPILIAGPESGPRAVFYPRACCNTISLLDSSHIIIRNLEVDGQGTDWADAVKAEGHANFAHHITLESLYIHDHDGDQQIVGISTKCPAWDWVIRGNIIETSGTGLYLGNSDGSAPFVAGLIEGNLIQDTVGYNLQIKHQNPRPTGIGLPVGDSETIIRHNVFSKANNASGGGMARPNLLVGHFPLSGAGMNDTYLIYGNFFWDNPSREPLFQGEGNIALYDNLFVNNNGSAVWIQPHNDVPKMIRVFNNTVVAADTGLRVTGGDPAFTQLVTGNAVFAGTPLNGGLQVENVTDTYANAANYLTNPGGSPTGNPTTLDLYPLPGTLTGAPLDNSSFNSFLDWDRDFNNDQHDGTYRGAYAGAGANPGWMPKLERKPLGDLTISGIVTENGSGLGGVAFFGSGAACSVSDSSGGYLCFVTDGWSGEITPSLPGYSFVPLSRSYVNLTADISDQDYVATDLLLNKVYIPTAFKNTP
jgi:hypothetical protein